MMWRGRFPAPTNTRCGVPTAAATSSPTSPAWWRETALRWNRWRRRSSRTSMATARSVFPRSRSKRTARPSWSRSAAITISTASGSGTGPELQYHGAPVTAGDFARSRRSARNRPPVGMMSAWKIPGTNQYEVWSTDSSGHFIANITGLVAGNSVALEIAGDDVPAGPQWRRHDRYSLGHDRSARLDQAGPGRQQLLSRQHQQRHRPRIAIPWRPGHRRPI